MHSNTISDAIYNNIKEYPRYFHLSFVSPTENSPISRYINLFFFIHCIFSLFLRKYYFIHAKLYTEILLGK